MASWLLALLLSLCIAGCASGPADDRETLVDENGNPVGKRLLVFRLSVNGTINRSSTGYYLILLNAQGQQIEATDLDTFTDFIRYDGINFDWFHRQVNQPNPGFTFVQAANLNQAGRLTPDGRTIEVVLDVGESTSLINQFVVSQSFTTHALTTDAFQGALIGRALDTLGQGPNLGANSVQTLRVRKGEGATQPLPQSYPFDPVTDFIIQGDLPPDYPYPNFDITSFEVTAQ